MPTIKAFLRINGHKNAHKISIADHPTAGLFCRTRNRKIIFGSCLTTCDLTGTTLSIHEVHMSTHHHSTVNPLVNPVTSGDHIISESGERYMVMQTINGHYWLRHLKDGFDLTRPIDGQIGICRQIHDLANV